MKQHRKSSAMVVALLAVLLLSFSSCQSEATPDYTEAAKPGVTGDSADQSVRTEETEGGSILPSPVPEGGRIIRGADISAKSKTALDSYHTILQWVLAHNGYESWQNVSFDPDPAIWSTENSVQASLHIPPEHFDDFLVLVGETVTVTRQNVHLNDITAQYADIELREKAQRKNLEAYYRLLEEARTVGEIVTVRRAIDELTLEIESHQALLKDWDQQLEFSEISINIWEPSPFAWVGTYFWQLFFLTAGLLTLILVLLARANRKKRQAQQAARAAAAPPSWSAGPPTHNGAPYYATTVPPQGGHPAPGVYPYPQQGVPYQPGVPQQQGVPPQPGVSPQPGESQKD